MSFGSKSRSHGLNRVASVLRAALIGGVLVAGLSGVVAAQPLDSLNTTPDPFAHPAELERDVRFWIRVYTEVTTDQGLLHDDRNLGLVYEVLRFDPGTSPAQRERRVGEAKTRYAALLRRFAAGDTDALTQHERRILHSFGAAPTPQEFGDAAEHLRFQLGQADRFHDGLIRAAAWEPHIARVLTQHGVPAELAALPHVESSFNLAAYSKVGAAGLWQFMPSTAKRFMRVDNLVDERLDPYTATEAAANLMLYNFRQLGTWPLTVTAYNHGPGGLRHAQDDLGTSDIAMIVKHYQGATFGFASRNFYVAFLAALEVDRNAERYFGPLTRLPNTESTPVELPDYVAVDVLARAFKVDMGALRVLNPALRPPIWSGSRLVPRGYLLRIPGTVPSAEIEAGWARLPLSQRYLAQRNDGMHRLRRGETVAGVAAASGMSLNRLLAANGLSAAHPGARGGLLRIPMPPSRAEVGANANADASAIVIASGGAGAGSGGSSSGGDVVGGAGVTVPQRVKASLSAPLPAPLAATVPPPEPTAQRSPPAPKEPVSQRQTDPNALLPVVSPSASADTTDYGVHADDTIIVQPAETLGRLADWTQTDAPTLRAANKLHKNAEVALGRKVKLDFSKVNREQFVAVRRDYHRFLQEAYFAGHRIAGTENYTVKRGDSLWSIARRHDDLPVWLMAQYNPDVDLAAMRPGTPITLPRAAAINRQ